jgi:hypothetical protein
MIKINLKLCVLLELNFSIEPVMENIIDPNQNFDFSKLALAQPIGVQGGAYFTKILNNTKFKYNLNKLNNSISWFFTV